MKKNFLFLPALLLLISSCQTLYTYRLPNESETKRFGDSLRWGYSGNTITSIPVAGDNGAFYRLAVTPKTKIEVKTTEGLTYRFYIQSIKISGEEGFLGSNQTWTGYELLGHVNVTILSKEIKEMKILSDEKATVPIEMH